MRRLQVLAALLTAFSIAWFSIHFLNLRDGNRDQDEYAMVEPITKSEPLQPYPDAQRVNLLVNDVRPDSGTGQGQSSKPEGFDLTAPQRSEFEQAVRKITLVEKGDMSANACFDPHHFFRYYDASGKKIGEIAVCFCCWNTRETPILMEPTEKVWSEIDIEAVQRFVKKMGLPTEVHCNPL